MSPIAIGNSVAMPFWKPTGAGFSAEYQLVYDAMVTKPTGTDVVNQAAMLDALVAGGYFAKAEFLDVFCTHSNIENEAKLDWKNPSGGISVSYISHINGYDWPDGNSDGVGDGWSFSGGGACSIVTGNGFTGNAQRVTHVNGAATHLRYSTGVNAIIGQRYRVKGKFRAGAIWWSINLRPGLDTMIRGSGLEINAGNAITFEGTIIATGNTEIILSFEKGATLANDYLEIDEVEVMTWNHNPTIVNNPAHTPYVGFLSDRVNYRYLDLNFIPSIDATLISQDNVCVIIGIGTDFAEDLYDFGSSGAASANALRIGPRSTGSLAYFVCNGGSGTTLSLNSKGYFALSRGLAANFDFYKDFGKINKTGASTGLSPASLFGGGFNMNEAPSITNKEILFIFCFTYLTETEIRDIMNIMNNYLVNYSTNLIPKTICAEYQAVYNQMINKPNDWDKFVQNIMAKDYVDAGLWNTKLDRRFIKAVHTNAAGEAQLDWINPSVNPPLLNVNGCVFTAYEGFQGDGLTRYMNTQYNPAVNGVLFTLNNAVVSSYSRTAGILSDVLIGNNIGGSLIHIAPKWGGTAYGCMNTNNNATSGNPTGSGEYILSRVLAANEQLYWNTIMYTANHASISIPNGNIYLLARNAGVAETLSARQISKSIIGAGYSQTDVNNETDIFETYMRTYNKGVIA